MTQKTIDLQNELDCTTTAQPRQYPIAIKQKHSNYRRWLVLSQTKEIEILQWDSKAVGLEYLDAGAATEIPAASLITELKAIIEELEGKS